MGNCLSTYINSKARILWLVRQTPDCLYLHHIHSYMSVSTSTLIYLCQTSAIIHQSLTSITTITHKSPTIQYNVWPLLEVWSTWLTTESWQLWTLYLVSIADYIGYFWWLDLLDFLLLITDHQTNGYYWWCQPLTTVFDCVVMCLTIKHRDV